MLDVALIVVVIGFFGLCALMVRWCGTLIGTGAEARADTAEEPAEAPAEEVVHQ